MAVQSPVKNETLFDFKAKVLEGGAEVPLSQYKGKVILVMNIASMWDLTKQEMPEMNELLEKFGEKLVILAFSCNQFGHQVCLLILII